MSAAEDIKQLLDEKSGSKRTHIHPALRPTGDAIALVELEDVDECRAVCHMLSKNTGDWYDRCKLRGVAAPFVSRWPHRRGGLCFWNVRVNMVLVDRAYRRGRGGGGLGV